MPTSEPLEIELAGLTTEQRHPDSLELDQLSALELVRLVNSEDASVVAAVGLEVEAIAQGIELIAERLARGGRLVYVGAGTSGRLGLLDALECPPTFNSPPAQVLALLAGGPEAMLKAVEGAEDLAMQGALDVAAVDLGPADVAVGITASGRTPYVLGSMHEARRRRAATIGIACNSKPALADAVDLLIAPVVGPEVLSGSTRMKAGTATKMVLNMLSTGAMVRLGKTWSNLMVDLKATNAKLGARAVLMLQAITGCTPEVARAALSACDGEVKTAALLISLKLEPAAARARLAEHGGRLRQALGAVQTGQPVG